MSVHSAGYPAIFSRRTDLASELKEMHAETDRFDPDGIESEEEILCGIKVGTIRITNSAGAEKLSKPQGTYITLETGMLRKMSSAGFRSVCDALSICLGRLIPKSGSCLVAALGNRAITADAIGPRTAERFLVTHHIRSTSPGLFGTMGLRDSACVVPDVMGNTGIEGAQIIRSVVERVRPDFVVAVDALASRKTSRLCSTLQLCDTGICPGSGIGNRRMALTKETLGVPVIAVGVPTVVDAVTIGLDILEEYAALSGYTELSSLSEATLRSVLSDDMQNYCVTPKDADSIIAETADIIGLSLSKALNPSLTYEEIREML